MLDRSEKPVVLSLKSFWVCQSGFCGAILDCNMVINLNVEVESCGVWNRVLQHQTL